MNSSLNISTLSTFSNDKIELTLNQLANKYYNGESIISDSEWDTLYEWYREKNPSSEFFNLVGSTPLEGKIKLPIYMGSLNKIKPESKEYSKFISKAYDLIISEKLDGVSLLVKYHNQSIQLFTRGNGTYGQNVSHILAFLPPFPQLTQNIVIRGELILPQKVESSQNLRNIISGQVNAKKPNKTILQQADFVGYSLPNFKLEPYQQFQQLNQWGFKTPRYVFIHQKQIVTYDFSQMLKEWRSQSQYDIDGIVISYNQYETVDIGSNPKLSKAFKTILQDQIAKSRVIHIKWNLTKDKYLKPVIQVEPIEIGKCTIKHITGNNAKFIQDHKIGIGSQVEIIRSGDVIPKIHKVLTTATPCQPEIDFHWSDNYVDYIASNSTNNDSLLLLHFVKTLGMKHISNSTCQKCTQHGISNIEKFLNLDIPTLLTLPSIKDKQANKIYQSIQTSIENCNLVDFIVSTNLLGRHFGRTRLEQVLNNINYKDLLDIHQPHDIYREQLISIEGISFKLADMLLKQLTTLKSYISKNPTVQKIFMDKIHHYTTSFQSSTTQKSLQGVAFCFSGFRRIDIEQQLLDKGGKILSGVSQKLNYLVVPDLSISTSSKVIKAKQYNIPIINIEFLESQFDINIFKS